MKISPGNEVAMGREDLRSRAPDARDIDSDPAALSPWESPGNTSRCPASLIALVFGWVLLFVFLVVGCSGYAKSVAKNSNRAIANADALHEVSRVLTTAALDATQLAPTNPPRDLALRLLKSDQLIEGLPTNRIDVEAVLAGKKDAVHQMESRMGDVDRLLVDRDRLHRDLEAARSELVELGKKYEEERNRSIVARAWRWGLGTVGIGGMIALAILFPAVIPLLGTLIGWLVSRVPILADFLGVVGKRALDSVVDGVGRARASIKTSSNAGALADLNDNLGKSLKTSGTLELVEARRKRLAV